MIISKQCTNWDSVIQVLQRSGFIVIFGPSAEVTSLSLDTIKSFEDVKCLQSQQLVKSHGRKMKTRQRELASKDVVAFWLVEQCPSNPEQFEHHVMRTLMEKGYGSLLSMTAYVYKSKISDVVVLAYCEAGVRVELLPQEDEWGRITMLSVNMTERTMFYWGTANFLVISKPFKSNSMWRHVIYLLSLRDCSVFCERPDYMFTLGSYLWSTKDLLSGSSPPRLK